jgi:Zn-dependent protease with chaperone function
MTQTVNDTRVCPQCGTSGGLDDRCTSCGLDLARLKELPTRAEWLSQAVQASTTMSSNQRSSSSRSVSRSSVRPLLHPGEGWRLMLASIASAVAIALPIVILVTSDGVTPLIALMVFLALVLASVWFGTQMRRARLLGQSVRVDADTFPDLQGIIEDVRATLQYQRRVEVYVTESAKPNVVMTSLLGTRLILIDGGLVADLLQPGKRAQVTFLLGRSFGALRAKQTRLDLVIVILQAAEVLQYVKPLILPYYRATAYSGDQIGMMCCGDLGAALEATRRLLVGGEMASHLGDGSVLPQCLLVKKRVLPRLAQMLSPEPHVINRYANLLCFGRYHDPQLWDELKASMDEREEKCLDAVWQRSPYRRRVELADWTK